MRAKVFVDYFRASFPNGSETDFALPEDNLILREVDGLPFLLDAEEGSGSIGFGFTVFAGGLPFNFDFSRVYGHGRKVLNPFPVVLGPAEDTFVDGLKFDFSIAYDF